MEQKSNQLLFRNDYGVCNTRSTNNHSVLSNRFPHNQCSVSSNPLPNVDSNIISNQLPGGDSGVSCKCKHYSESFPSEDNQDTNSRNDDTRRKSVNFSMGSSLNLIDGHHCVTDIKIDSDSETNSDPTFVNTESTSSYERNGNSSFQDNSYISRHSRACIHEISTRNNNTTFKSHRSAYSESDGTSIMLSHCNCIASKMNTRTTFPILGMSLNTDFRPDQRSILHHHQQLPGTPCSTKTQGQHNFPQCLPGTCHDHTQPNLEATSFRSHPNIYHEVERNFDPLSSAPLLDDICHIASRGPCATSPESPVLLHETQPSKTVTKSALSNTKDNKMIDEESTVSVPRSCCTNNKIKNCLVILLAFNIISLVAIGFIFFNHRPYQECPLCKDVMEQVKMLRGGNINDSDIQEYLNENNKNGRCCVNHAFIFNLLAQTNPRNQAHQQYTKSTEDTIKDIIKNTSEKVALHLESLKGTIPFISELPDDGLPSQRVDMEMLRWDFHAKESVKVGKSWDILESDTKIKVPLTGFYYIYAMVQYRYKPGSSTPPSDNMPNVQEFPLSISLYKYTDKKQSIIGTVTQHCKFVTMSVEHNIIIERIVRLTKDDKVFLAVSNKQSFRNDRSIHQIGFLRVD